MKRRLFLLVAIWMCCTAYSQSLQMVRTNDSLWSIWSSPEQHDTLRLKAIEKYAWNFLSVNTDSTFFYCQMMYDFAQPGNYKEAMGTARATQGESFRRKGNFRKALEYYTMSLAIREQTNDKKSIAKTINSIGSAHQSMGNYDSALVFFERGLSLSEELGYQQGEATALYWLAVIYRDLGEFSRALSLANKCLAIRTELGDKEQIGNTLGVIGNIYMQQGDYVMAFELFQQSNKLADELGNKSGVAISYNSLGTLYRLQGDYTTALDYAFRSLAIFEEVQNRSAIASMLINIGGIYVAMYEVDTAVTYFLRALVMQRELGNRINTANVLTNLGTSSNLLKQFDLGITYLKESIKIREELGDKMGVAITMTILAEILYSSGKYEEALALCKKARAIALEADGTNLKDSIERWLFLTYVAVNQPDSALTHLSILRRLKISELERNYFTLSEREKELYFINIEHDFNRYYDFTLEFHKRFDYLTDTAYTLALQNKGLALKSSTAMRQAILTSGDSLLTSDYNNWIALKREISQQYSSGEDITELEKRAREIEKQLVKRSEVFSDFDKIKNLDWKQVRESLEQGECAIEFVNFRREIDTAQPYIYAAFVVKPASVHPEMVKLCNEADLKKILGTFQGNNNSFVNAVYGTRAEAQTALYELIWRPLEEHLEGVKTIYFSPSGLLHKISFASICKTQNVYLSDLYNFRQMSSTGKVAMQDDVAFGELENFLLMGGVKYNSDTTEKEIWNYLPGTLAETEAINSYLQKKKFGVNYFKEGNASESIFKEKITSSSIVHIATHGFFFPDPEEVREEMSSHSESDKELKFRGTTNYANWSFVNSNNPLMRSGIVLARANDVWQRGALTEGEDGILTAQEVSNLDLRNTKLVVLSACETGLGDIKGSEGVYGLQRAFKMAGVKYLIMSLWQVPDKETSEFMQLFYTNLIKVKDIPLAFQKTQQVMRKKYDPYYWGAFVLIE